MSLSELIFGKKKYDVLSSEEFETAIRTQKKIYLLDVRAKSEFDDRKIPNALNLDIRNPNFKNKIAQFDPAKAVYIYCQSGKRAGRACDMFVKLGFEKVYNLKGGLIQYEGRTI